MTRELNWERDGRDWPHCEASRFVTAAGLRWHLQRFGDGSAPALLLAHGTGASSHSWRGLAPLLARHFTVYAPDLPGHGFTGRPPSGRLSLPVMADALQELLRTLAVTPVLAVGHSAGAAILARLCLDAAVAPALLVSLNGALLPLRGVSGKVFSPLAKLLTKNPLVSRLFAWRGSDHAAVERLIRSTGSSLDPQGIELYARLLRSRQHVAGVLNMMADWDLQPLRRDLPRLRTPLLLVVGAADRAVPPADARRVQALLPDNSEIVTLPGLGHLAHEESPDEIAELVLRRARALGIIAPPAPCQTE